MPSVGKAADVTLTAQNAAIPLGEGHLAYLRDPAGKLQVNEAIAALDAGDFTSISGNLSLGFSKDALWVASTLQREPGSPDKWVLRLEPPTLDLVELYQVNNGQWQKQISGDGVPVSMRAMFHRSPAFTLALPEGTTRLLMRIKTTSQVTAIPFLSQASAFDRARMTETLLLGLYFGALLIVLVYNLVIGISVHQRLYFLYCLLVLTHGAFWSAFDGLLGLYLFPDRPILANMALGILLGIATFVANYFWMNALKVGPEYKISRALMMVVYLVALASVVSVPLGAMPRMLPWLLASLVLSVAVIGSHALRNLRAEASIDQRIFGAAYLLYGGTVAITVLTNFSLLPAELWSAYIANVGQFVHILALHFGLYFQVRNSQREQQQSQYRLANVQREAEKERAIRQDQEQLLHMIGHEVRTPIAIISSAVDSLKLLEEESSLDPLKQQRFERIQKAVKRMEMLMQLVGAERKSRMEAVEPPELETLNFSNLCTDNLDLLVDTEQRIHFTSEPDWIGLIRGDAGMLGFLLLNLFDNALKYAIGKQPIQVHLQPATRDGREGALLTICNRARPLAPGMEERIFGKYVRIDESRSQPGLGLGLYLARNIAEQHGGTLKARNSGADQVCFELWLPLHQEGKA